MAQINPPKKIQRRQEMRQDTLGTYTDRAVETFETHRRPLVTSGIIALVLVLGFIGYSFWQDARAEDAADALGSVVRLYEAGEYRQALEGTADAPGLVEIAEDYGSTDAGNLAHYYAADAYLRLGELDNALTHFDAFDAENDAIGAAAYAGQAAVYEDQGDFEQAARFFERAAATFENAAASPMYLMNAARNYEQAGDYDAARDAYETIREDYAESNEARELDKYLARLDAMAGTA